MLVPYEWLKEYVEADLPPSQLADALTLLLIHCHDSLLEIGCRQPLGAKVSD